MTKITKRETALLLVLLIAAAGFLYYQFFYVGFRTKLTAAQDELDRAKQTLQVLEQKEKIVQQQRSELEALQSSAQTTLSSVLPAFDQPLVLDELRRIAEPLCASYDLDFQIQSTPLEYGSVESVTLTAYTNYADLKLLLGDLAACPYVNRTVVASLSNNEADPGQLGSDPLYCQLQIEFLTLNGTVADQTYPFEGGAYGNSQVLGD
ncbi:MAG: hypothetical protein PHD32_03175 [Eubacteriales bacterium]|nr:hypothetical protein [Eubacteriales bacterium]